jgi:hypothetical protein
MFRQRLSIADMVWFMIGLLVMLGSIGLTYFVILIPGIGD